MKRSNDQSAMSHYQWVGWSLVAAIFLLWLGPGVMAQEPTTPIEAMLIANQNYETGQYAEAIAGYEAIVAAGVRSSDLYYNLGNAYFKQGDWGRAILNYRRAQRLDPTDTDIATNLAVARAQTVDKLEVPPEGVLINVIELAEEWLTLNQAAILALFLWLIICFLAILAIFWPRLRRISLGLIALAAIFLIIGLISMANRLYKTSQLPPAVVVAQQVDVTSGPGDSDQYLVEFELHSGAEVRLLESRLGWRRITLPGDLQGWVPAEAVEIVLQGGG